MLSVAADWKFFVSIKKKDHVRQYDITHPSRFLKHSEYILVELASLYYIELTMTRTTVVASFIASVVLLNCCQDTVAYFPAVNFPYSKVFSKHGTNTNIGKSIKYFDTSVSVPATRIQLRMIADLPSDDGSGLSYAERSRPYRRDVFDSDEWVRVRNTARFSKNLLTIFQSGIVRQLLNEAIFIGGTATFLCLYNALLVNGYDDFSGIHHDPFGQGFYEFKLPSIFFTLTSPALSLLLGKCDNVLPGALLG